MTRFIKVYSEDGVGVIQFDRPKVLNALNREMVDEIVTQLEAFDLNESIRVIVLKGSEKAFAAGADIEEMMEETSLSLELLNPFAQWDRISLIKKPLLAAVNGFALGGGFELALHCDLIIASEDAKFGFPEVKLGILPGAGGTQFLTKVMGVRRALEWIWLGEQMTAREALHYGVINRSVAPELVEEETMRLAHQLSKQAPISLRLIKEAVHAAADLSLLEGKMLERKNFYLAFSSEDQKEGMRAFTEKRTPSFRGK
ncbi:enoyl-CoA hydratase/isomerase family protein [Ornithinibacillus massiliensis]|uniref:Enoyl-CoA hydratase/isomerase family protein n=1 Tax=Ornithinibacillus massiliensis TaxID=1944633 RepID=A0ABS5M9V9_9BACI|nr:enoyl-CoA hydratase-related protein [Ornithinibacillus massiliensis]MBS3679084.1 enoyl-CoA hydratase/isomerase family protein [Ornithinibacillus massiliensis]